LTPETETKLVRAVEQIEEHLENIAVTLDRLWRQAPTQNIDPLTKRRRLPKKASPSMKEPS
jgi:hypothetical protein